MQRILLVFLILPILLFARGKVVYKQVNPNIEPPWLTGPLLAPAAMVVPAGYCNIEPYFFETAYTGVYNSDWDVIHIPTFWSTTYQIPIQVGLTKWMNFQFSPTGFWNYNQHQASWALGDLPVELDFQLYSSPLNSLLPSVKLALRETVPIGKYRNLNPKKLLTDAGGEGTWSTGLGLVIGHAHHITSVYYFNYRIALSYYLPAPVRLKGLSLYGGGYGTNVRMFPSQIFLADLGIEVTLAQTWAFALDVVGEWANKQHFTGNPGTLANGAPASLKGHSLAQFSLAPAIEYNWSPELGAIAGAWFTVAGRNAVVFTSGVFAFNYYF